MEQVIALRALMLGGRVGKGAGQKRLGTAQQLKGLLILEVAQVGSDAPPKGRAGKA
jgi:hypothetical protein